MSELSVSREVSVSPESLWDLITEVLAGTIGKLFEGGTRKALVKDLDDIAVVAEADE